jgi:hypothetical protein
MEKQRTTFFLVLIVLGAGLLAYGLSSRAAVVSSDEQVQPVSTSELPAAPAVAPAGGTQEVAQAAAATETPSQVRKPDADAKKAPAACPT